MKIISWNILANEFIKKADYPMIKGKMLFNRKGRLTQITSILQNVNADVMLLQEVMEDQFNTNLYRDVSDLYGKSNSQRQFYQMPSTTIPNEQTKFALWCYGIPENNGSNSGGTCKENPIQCAPITNSI